VDTVLCECIQPRAEPVDELPLAEGLGKKLCDSGEVFLIFDLQLAAGYEREAVVHLQGLFAVMKSPAQLAVPHFPRWSELASIFYVSAQVVEAMRIGRPDPTATKTDGPRPHVPIEDVDDVMCQHPNHRKAFSSRMVSCFFWQVISVLDDGTSITGKFKFRGRGDAPVVRWLYTRLLALQNQKFAVAEEKFNGLLVRRSSITSQGAQQGALSKAASNETYLELAVMAYVISIAYMYVPTAEYTAAEEAGAERHDGDEHLLVELQARIKGMLLEWAESGSMHVPSDTVVRQYVALMTWFESDEGIRCLKFLADALEPEPASHIFKGKAAL
jgi:hypothetical protein